MIDSLVTAFRAPDIRRKILFTLGILFIFRILTTVPVAGVDQARLSQLFESNQLLGLLPRDYAPGTCQVGWRRRRSSAWA